MLKDESLEIDFVGPTLPALKQLLEVSLPKRTDQETEEGRQLIHGLFSTCIQNIDEIGTRQGTIPDLKVKNNMLASVLIVTIIPLGMKLSKGAVEHLCYLISQKIAEGGESAHTSLHCAKTLITAAAAGNQILQCCVKLLIPGMISHMATISGQLRAEVNSISEADHQDIDETFKGFSSLFASFPEELRPNALGLLLPVLILLLDPGRKPLTVLHTMAVNQVLSWATISPGPFKDATSRLEAGDKEVLEASVRQAIHEVQNPTSTSPTVKPQISLRSF